MKIKAIRAIERHQMLHPGDTVLVALSGGADSMALLHVLYSLKDEYGIKIVAAHFNHGIRGEEAKRDENFCVEVCKSLGVELFIGSADIPALAKEKGLKMIAVTAFGDSEAAHLADYVLVSSSLGASENYYKGYSYLGEFVLLETLLKFVTNEELIELLKEYTPEAGRENAKKFMEHFGGMDRGDASRIVASRIETIMEVGMTAGE